MENAESLLTDEEIKQSESGKDVNSEYIQKSNGITITVSEIYHDYVAMYMTVQIYNEK